MRNQLNSLILAAFAVSTLGGCIVQREVVRDEPQAALPAPPPPPSDEVDAQPYAPVAAPEPAGGEVDEQVFVDRLSPYGHWEYVADYGRVWVPAAAVGWRPYWDGRWVLTEWGWTFVSDDPWGWATYHYGRWGFMTNVGWFWVPGRIWAPAWVSWRYGNGYCAWAPLGPRGYVYGYSSPGWVAVRQEHFTRPIARYGVSDARQVAPIVQRAQPLPAPRGRPSPGVHFGPPVAQVAAATGQAIHPVRAAAVAPRSVPQGAPSAGRSGGSAPARSAPSDGTARSTPSDGTSRSRPSAAPSSSAPASSGPGRAEPGSSGSSSGGRSQPQSAPSNGTPRAAPAHGGPSGSYRSRAPAETAPRGASVAPAPSGTPRYGGGPAPRPSASRASAARRGNQSH